MAPANLCLPARPCGGTRKMHRAVKQFRSYLDDARGVTAIEYGLIASIISIATALVVLQIGVNLQIIFQQATDMM